MKNTILNDLRKVVTLESISKLAFKHKFSKRSTCQIKGIDFLQILILGVSSGLEITYSSLNASLREIKPQLALSNQAIAKYFYKASSVDFIRSVYEKIFSFQKSAILLSKVPKVHFNAFDKFARILIEDSTYCALNEKSAKSYKGCGGTSSKAGLKIDVIQEFKSSAIIDLNIYPGNRPDSKASDHILKFAQEGDLILRDLGYSNLDVFAKLSEKKISFISRYHMSIKVYEDSKDKSSLDLGRFLTKKMGNRTTLDVDLYFGESRQRHRLIAYRVPESVSNERRRKTKRNAQCHGRTASEGLLNLCDYVIMITNIPEIELSAEVVGTIYRIRWSIELLFKSWKSHLCLQASLTGYKQSRIECCLYVILIVGLLIILIKGWLEVVLESSEKKLSLAKITQWLIFIRGSFRLLFGSVDRLKNDLKSTLKIVCNQNRRRKTTAQRVASNESYPKSYHSEFLIG